MIKAKYAVTFEFEINPPLTIRGEIEANKLERLAWRAIEDAKKQSPKKITWTSLVIVLDRADNATMNSQ